MYERTKVQQELLTRLETHLQWFPIHMLFQRNQVTAYSVCFGLFIQENILRDNSNPNFFFAYFPDNLPHGDLSAPGHLEAGAACMLKSWCDKWS